MTDGRVAWDDDVDEVLQGDLTAAVAYVTPAGGAVATAVAPCGLSDRGAGTAGFTTSLGFGKKLERIARDPRIALAFHTREHGFSSKPPFVLVQGDAGIEITPSPERLEAFAPEAVRYLGAMKRGRVWDRLLREYYAERVFVDIAVHRVVRWPHLDGGGQPDVAGAEPPAVAAPQDPPKLGTAPRVDVDALAGRLAGLTHRVLAFRGADGYPVVVPFELAGHDHHGLRLVDAGGLLPPGGRRAGLLAHSYRPQLVGLATRVLTGWLEVDDEGRAVYAPHTSKGFLAPPRKRLLLVSNGLLAKYGLRQARRHGRADELARLVAARGVAAPEPS